MHSQWIEGIREIDLLKHRVGELKNEAEESKKWRRSLLGPILAAIIGSTLTALLGLLLYYLRG